VKTDQFQYIFFIVDDQDALFGHAGLSFLSLTQISDIFLSYQIICLMLA
jgi:hypothetical protein